MVEIRSANPNRRKPRASKPKVRTGCITCKIRRVKCDETKPGCLRCKKFGRECDGYPGGQRYNTDSAARLLLPRVSSTQLTQYSPPPGTPFENDQEYRYFKAFLDETAVDLAGAFDSNLWARLIPQASQTEPFVRHAAIAIGALGKVLRTRATISTGSEFKLLDESAFNEHHQFALRQYDKAIRCMTDSPGENEAAILRKCLLASVLVFCFESFHGDHDTAMIHLQSGLSMMHEWLGKTPYPPSGKPGISSPAPLVVDDELVHAFARLDLQVMTFVDVRPVQYHQKLKNEGTSTISTMPDVFKDLNEARLFWELIMRRICHFLHTAVTQKAGRKFSLYPEADTLEEKMLKVELDDQDGKLYAEHDEHVTAIKRWTQAFEPLHNIVKTTGTRRQILGATILQIHSMISKIMAASVLFSSELQYDIFLPEFRKILELCKYGLKLTHQSPTVKPLFSFDLGLISPLHLVSVKCRDRALRREAISLLVTHPHREGVWDSVVAAQLGYWMMEFEEQGVTTNHIPEHARAKVSNVVVDLKQGRRAVLEYARMKTEDGDEVMLQDKVLTW